MGKQKTPICTFTQCYGLGFCLIALHVYLDCITTYGTMIFLPFSDYRVRLNGMFIVDVWLLIPMVLACCLPRIRDNSPPRSRNPAVRALLLGACAWMLLYPAFTVFWRAQLEGQELIALVDKAPLKPTVLPDALSPLHWRILYATQGVSLPLQGSAVLPAASPDTVSPTSPRPDIPLFPPETSVHQQALTAFAQPDGPLTNYPAANPQLTAHLSAQDRSCRVFFRFTLLPLQYTDSWEGGTEYIFYDLRFHTLVPFVHDMMQMRAGGRSGGVPFLLRVRLNHQGELTSVRMTFSGSGLDSGWKPPQTPQQATWAQWLVGL